MSNGPSPTGSASHSRRASPTSIPDPPDRNVWGDHSRKPNLGDSGKRNSWFGSKTKPEEVVGDYQVGKQLGAGGVGVVRRCKHIVTGQKFAIKHIDMDEKKLKFIKREIAISRLLYNPYVVQLFDVMYDNFDKEVDIVIELVDGVALLDYIISHGSLKEKAARPFFRQIISAVEYCHLNGIVHRDLKIENILIDKRGVAKLIDFGLSNLWDPNGFLLTNCGSIYFAAPELLVKAPYRGPEVDIWAIGVILYVMLNGRVPFEDRLPKLYEKIKAGEIRWVDSIRLSDDAMDLIKRMITVDTKKRATLEEVMTHPWVNEGYPSPPRAILPERKPLTHINKDVVARLDSFNFNPKEIQSVLEKAIAMQIQPVGVYHPILSIYYLTMEKMERDKAEAKDASQRAKISDMMSNSNALVSPPTAHHASQKVGTINDHSDVFPEIVIQEDQLFVETNVNQPPSRPTSLYNNIVGIATIEGGLSVSSSNSSSSSATTATGTSLFVPGDPSAPVRKRSTTGNSPKAVMSIISSAANPTLTVSSAAAGSSLAAPAPHSPSGRRRATSSAPRPSPAVFITPTKKEENNTLLPPRVDPSMPATMNNLMISSVNSSPQSSATPSPTSSYSSLPSGIPVSPNEVPKQINVKGLFSVSTTSTKAPYLIRDEILRVLVNNSIGFKDHGYRFSCSHKSSIATEKSTLHDLHHADQSEVVFELQVVKVGFMNMHGILLKRYSGDAWQYKSLCHKLLQDLHL